MGSEFEEGPVVGPDRSCLAGSGLGNRVLVLDRQCTFELRRFRRGEELLVL